MLKIFFLAFSFFVVQVLFGQQLPAIQTDRPDQTECPFITPKKYLQAENGFSLEYLKSGENEFLTPSTLWKYGINNNVELRLITNISANKFFTPKNHLYITPITIGFKTKLLNEQGIIPTTSFIAHLTTAQLGNTKFHTSFAAPSFRFTMQHTLSNKISLGYNLGAEWDGETAEPTYLYTITTGISLLQNLSTYIELYGYSAKTQQTDHRFDGGFCYYISNNFMLDVSAGLGFKNSNLNNYYALGISYRINTKRK